VCDPTESISQIFEEISSFIVPAIDAGVNVSVKAACRWLVGCCVIVKDDSEIVELQIASSDLDNNTLFLVNKGAEGNPIPGTVLSDPSSIFFKGKCSETAVTPDDEHSFRMITSELFVVPDVGANSTLKLEDNIGLSVGQSLFLEGGVCVEVTSISVVDGVTCVEVEGLSLPSGVLPGSIIPSGSFVVTSDTCISTDDTIDGTGTSSDPFSVFNILPCAFLEGPEIDMSILPPLGPTAVGKDLSNMFDKDNSTFTDVLTWTTDPNNFIGWDFGTMKKGHILVLADIRHTGIVGQIAEFCLTVGFDDTAGLSGQQRNTIGANQIHTESPVFVANQEFISPFVGRFIGMNLCALTAPSAIIRFRNIKVHAGDFTF